MRKWVRLVETCEANGFVRPQSENWLRPAAVGKLGLFSRSRSYAVTLMQLVGATLVAG